MRLKNLRGLRLGVHVLRDQRGIFRITVPGEEVKNGTPIDSPCRRPRPTFSRFISTSIARFWRPTGPII
jgi:hypothetical protein